MTDIRDRLVNALRDGLNEMDGPGYDCAANTFAGERLADVLSSLPGIAIVELPKPLPGGTEIEMPRWEMAQVVVRANRPDWVLLNSQALEPYQARALAARLLAAADLTEQDNT